MAKDAKLRGMIVDCLKYLPKDQRKWNTRYDTEVEIHRWYESASVEDIKDKIIEIKEQYPTANDQTLYISNVGDTDPYEDYQTTYITLNMNMKIGDEEWFDAISDCICPNKYQLEEYRQYQLLKFKYEGK